MYECKMAKWISLREEPLAVKKREFVLLKMSMSKWMWTSHAFLRMDWNAISLRQRQTLFKKFKYSYLLFFLLSLSFFLSLVNSILDGICIKEYFEFIPRSNLIAIFHTFLPPNIPVKTHRTSQFNCDICSSECIIAFGPLCRFSIGPEVKSAFEN